MSFVLDLDDLEALFPHANDVNRQKFLQPLNITIERFRINTPDRIAAFFAQLEVESGSLHYVREIADGKAYTGRKDLGNASIEAVQMAGKYGMQTGPFYKGRGLIQITGYYNMKACGEALGLDLVEHPELLEEPLNAALSAGWYWDAKNCNSLADVKMFGKITKVINGGYNGAEERLKVYKRNLKYFGVS